MEHKMTLETLKLRLKGERALLLHNGQLADGDNGFTKAIKEITGKGAKNRTEAENNELKKLEWLGGLYLNERGLICVTEDMVLSCLERGAASSAKLGKKVKAGVICTQLFFPIKYDGPKDPLTLYEAGKNIDRRMVGVNQKRIARVRPRFDHWSIDIELLIETTTINIKSVIEAMKVSGRIVGLGDFRPRFGRFSTEKI